MCTGPERPLQLCVTDAHGFSRGCCMSSGAGIGAPNGAPCLPRDAGAVAPDLMTGRPVQDPGLPGNVGSDPPTVLTLSRDVDEDDDNTVEHALDGR